MSDPKTLSENKTYYIKAGDLKPVLELILYNEDGTVKDLTDTNNIKLVVAPCVGGRRIVDLGDMDMSETPTDGVVTYEWAEDELVAGEHKMEVILDLGTATESFPKGSYYKLVVIPHL